ncbi:hypothetical protein D6K32_25160, partial [Salmonella enterica subsp. enterica serovar Richmond]|nr:hypothetical protein [Salmonella enterica subsp. enterica serovar Richmond]
GLSDGDVPLSRFVIAENVDGYAGYYQAWQRTGPGQGYFPHRWYASRGENDAVPDTVKVCLRRQQTTGQSSNGCQDIRQLGAGGTDLWPRVPVTVDIPKLTVYLGPAWNVTEQKPDTGFARDADASVEYGSIGCLALAGPLSFNGGTYRYTRTHLNEAPTKLEGTPGDRTDYAFAAGDVLPATWVQISSGGVAGKAALTAASPRTVDLTVWKDLTHTYKDAQGGETPDTLFAYIALAPVSAPNDDVNYVAGRRRGTTDRSVAMINVTAGATAGTAMAQPNGADWAAGGVACVLDRQ